MAVSGGSVNMTENAPAGRAAGGGKNLPAPAAQAKAFAP
jgi:hypothetical protein